MKRLLQRLAKLRGKSSKANGDASAERRERERERERERVKGYERIEWIYTRVEIRKSSIKRHPFLKKKKIYITPNMMTFA